MLYDLDYDKRKANSSVEMCVTKLINPDKRVYILYIYIIEFEQLTQ